MTWRALARDIPGTPAPWHALEPMRDAALIALAIVAHAWAPRAQASPTVAGVIGWLLTLLVLVWVVYAAMRAAP